ncbi:MAG: choice-of-anchor Q domain-containing protein [Dokdonella sp.]|uniref:choice-of-anchor Q domain-containing protein n=1 Tax=Dokdonella sp. TaxID=2291710 RepID=UPI003F812D49
MIRTRPLFFAIALAAASTAHAATFTVDTLADSGNGSLRDAINRANASADADVIQFNPGLAGTIDLTGGELVVGASVSIIGPGANRITLDANGRSRVFRFDNPAGETRSWAISGLTVTRGSATAANADSGGGLFYENPASSSSRPSLAISGVVFSANTASRKGGAVSVSGANLTLAGVTLSANEARGGFQPSGGALYLDRGLLSMQHCRVSDNSAELTGGGIRLASPGISAVITDTLIQGNSTTLSGGGIHAGTMQSLRISRSSLVDNRVTNQTEGGGLYFSGSTDAGAAENIIENSTFSANRTQHEAGRGSAIAVASGNLTVRNSTFANNATSPATAPAPNAGGAVWVANGTATRVTVQSTLFSRNTHGNSNLRVDLTRQTGVPESSLVADHNLFEASPAIGVLTSGNANREGDARLGELAYAGGPLPVHPIAADSPAIDAGANPGALGTDQRGAGFTRTIDANPCRRPLVHATDIGAYEYLGDSIFCCGFNG